MKPRLIILAGHSGSGKTWTRENDIRLKGIPCIDLGDVNRAVHGTRRDTFPGLMRELFWLLTEELTDHPAVICEGHFLPGSPSRACLARFIESAGLTHEWIDLPADLETNAARLTADCRAGKPHARSRMQQFRRDCRRYGIHS